MTSRPATPERSGIEHARMFGRPASAAEFRHINLVGGAIILVAAALPPIAASAWRHRIVRGSIRVVGWIAAVGGCVHGLTDMTEDALSLTGLHAIHYPAGFWTSIDRRKAGVQDAVFNEPWFFIEGCLWAVFVLSGLQPSARRRWLRSAVVVGALAYALRRAEGARRRSVVSMGAQRSSGGGLPTCSGTRAA